MIRGLVRIVAEGLVAAAILASVLSMVTEIAHAQGADDDRYYLLRDPFRRSSPFFSYPSRDLPPPPRPAITEPPSDQPSGVVFNSTADAEKDRLTPISEYMLVFGDSMADQLAQGLADAFALDRPEVAVIKRTRASSGFVRADFYDWPAQMPGLLTAEKASAIAIMLGANDRQNMRDETGIHEPRSDRWRELYGKRVEDTLVRLKEKGVPIFVVGMPSMRSQRLSDDMEYINDILRERAEKVGAIYADIWDGFVDENGEFFSTGPALDGQKRRLRLADGVHFTRAGGRKLAHYVERDLVRLFDQRAGRSPLLPQEAPETAPSGRPVAGPVLPLTQPAGPAGQLAGSGPRVSAPADPTAARVLVEGMPVEPISGRADDFRWPRPGAAAPADSASSQAVVAPTVLPSLAKSSEPVKQASPTAPSSQAKSTEPSVLTPTNQPSNQPIILIVPEERSAQAGTQQPARLDSVPQILRPPASKQQIKTVPETNRSR